MHYGRINKNDIANGKGVRVTLFVSGCRHHCEGCFNPETWNFSYGDPYTKEVEDEVLEALAPDHIAGLTLLGGEPMEVENQQVLAGLVKRVKDTYPNKNIWCYTGYTLESDLLGKCENEKGVKGASRCEVTDEMLSCIDVLVDGEFKLPLKDIRLKFRGSSNQRVIDLPASLKAGEVVLLDL